MKWESVDKVCINNMEFFAYHGVNAQEKTLGQTFQVDIEVSTSLKEAALSDDLEASIDYSTLFAITKEEVLGNNYDLIETIAEKISIRVLKLHGAYATTIRIRKPNAPIDGLFDHVEIQINRENE
jgi:7,8-dihydroneopterin aldolase/epimerase/oxygenase